MTDQADISAPARAYGAFASSVSDSLAYTDRNLTEEAQTRRRAEGITAARAALASAVPAEPTRTMTRDQVFAGTAPKTADEIALQALDRQKVSKLHEAGQGIEQIIEGASAARVAALADDLEALTALDPFEGRRVAGLLFDRAVQLGMPDAVLAAQEEAQTGAAAAWREALTQVLGGEDVSMATRAAIFYADPTGYAATFGQGVTVDYRAANRVAPIRR